MLNRLILSTALSIVSLSAADPGSKTDLWDISQGTIVTSDTGVWSPQIAITDMFGGMNSFPAEVGQVVFADGRANGSVHAVDWQTTAPVQIGSFALYASGDPGFANEREFASFTLKAKSSPAAADYDVTLYTYSTTHPYQFADPSNPLLVQDSFAPITAQYFRAEFVQWDAGRGFDGPRVIELDGFAPASLAESTSTSVLLLMGIGGLFLWRRHLVRLPQVFGSLA